MMTLEQHSDNDDALLKFVDKFPMLFAFILASITTSLIFAVFFNFEFISKFVKTVGFLKFGFLFIIAFGCISLIDKFAFGASEAS